jgi:hypothetical protein
MSFEAARRDEPDLLPAPPEQRVEHGGTRVKSNIESGVKLVSVHVPVGHGVLGRLQKAERLIVRRGCRFAHRKATHLIHDERVRHRAASINPQDKCLARHSTPVR